MTVQEQTPANVKTIRMPERYSEFRRLANEIIAFLAPQKLSIKEAKIIFSIAEDTLDWSPVKTDCGKWMEDDLSPMFVVVKESGQR